MKILAVFLLLAVVGQCTYANDVHHLQTRQRLERIFGSKIKNGLEKFKKAMKTGNESLGMPKLDPLDSDYQEIILDEEIINGEGKFSNVHIEGLSDFTIKKANYELLKSNVVIDLTWSNIKGNSLYGAEAKVMDKYPVYGAGNVSFALQNFNFATKIKVSLDLINKKVSIVRFSDTKMALEKLKLEITGLYNNEEISQEIGPVISEMAPEVLVDFEEEITKQVNKIMVPLGNQILENIDIWKFVNI